MMNILLIEDNELLGDNIKSFLENERFNVVHITNSTEGLEYSIKNSPDLILCDIMLPDKDGYEFFEILKKRIGTQMPPFIYLTAKSQRYDHRKSMELGADDFITKPFTKEELVNAVNTQISKRKELIKKRLTESPEINNSETEDQRSVKSRELSYEGVVFFKEKNSPGFFSVKKIVYIKSMKDYTQIFLNTSKKIVVRKTLSHWESILPSEFFVRIHRQTIINLDYLDKIEKDKNYTYKVHLRTVNAPLKISQRYGRKIKYE